MAELDGLLMPGPGALIWALGREELADPLCPDSLAACHPAWEEDARLFAPWQEVLVTWCSACAKEQWWLSPVRRRGRIVVSGRCSSALDVARPLAENRMLDPWDSVLAVAQWSGRGQLRRRWQSPPGNVYGALVLPTVPKEYDTLLPLVLGYCIAAFLRCKKLEASIKWPNDLLVGEAKVGGILVEERRGIAVAGIGLNLVEAPSQGQLRDGHAVPAGYLRAHGLKSGPLALWAELVDFVKICYETSITQGSPGDVIAMIEPLLCWLGETIAVRDGGEAPWAARLAGLAHDGALRVMPEGGAGERLLTSGSIWRVREHPLKHPG